jgi:hypothetical protein
METKLLNTAKIIKTVPVLDSRTGELDSVNIQPRGRITLAAHHTVKEGFDDPTIKIITKP